MHSTSAPASTRGDALGVVARVDAGADEVALVLVEKLVRIRDLWES
jgi:hypothetical protein